MDFNLYIHIVKPDWLTSQLGFATKQDVVEAKDQIMSQITDWASAEDADLTDIKGTLDGVVTGIAALDKLITDFQNSPGTLSPADQAALDAIQAKVKSLVGQAKGIDTTPPVAPAP